MANLRDKVSEDRLKTISDKVKAHDMSLAAVQELYSVVVTGDISRNSPGLLETTRNMASAIERIEQKLDNYKDLDDRLKVIEDRHNREDKEFDIKRTEIRNYRFYLITLGITQIITALFAWLRPT